MKPERWEQIDHLLQAALDRQPADRAAFLAEACAGDEELQREVESLLAFEEHAEGFGESPPDDLAAEMFAAEAQVPMTGRTLGRYRLGAMLGAGGMGEVYRATDTRLRREVAIKILPEHLASNAEALHRFEREARAVAALSHPNILAIYDFGTEEGVSFAVTELLEGETLRECLKRSPLNWRKTVEIGVAIAEGLAAAHAKGIIHRDLKPENIFLTTDGVVKILDFGIARVKHVVDADSETLTSPDTTRPGTIMGTIGYMSPEQVRGEEADAPSDIFSLGCVLYEMISGQRPFAYATAAETIAAILKEEPPTLAATGRKIPSGLERLIRACLEKQPSARLQSARDLAQGLKAVADGRETQQRFPAQARSRWRLVAIAGAAAVILLLSVLAWLVLANREPAIDSLAVLPLAIASSDEQTEILSDGISESIINSLSQLPQLKTVIARATASRYKGKEVDPLKVGKELNVRAVMIGKLIRHGDDLIVEAELVNTANGARLWGGKYPLKLADVLAVQAEIAKQISEKLRLRLTNEQQQRLAKRYTENQEANQLYVKGRYYSLKYAGEGYMKGVEFMKQAVELDPSYALAYAGLAASYYDASSTYFPPEEAMPKAEAAARQALRLDETLAEGHAALAVVELQYKWEREAARKGFQRALELNPNYAPAHQYYGYYWLELGQFEQAIASLKRAWELDPLTPQIGANLAWAYYMARRPDEAIAQSHKVLALDQNFPMTHYGLGLQYEQKRMFVEAIAELDKARRLEPNYGYQSALLGHVYASSGKRDEAQRTLNALMERAKREHVNPVHIAIIYAGLGDKDPAFEYLEKGYQSKYEEMAFLKVEPLFDSLRADPRFNDLLRRMNLAP